MIVRVASADYDYKCLLFRDLVQCSNDEFNRAGAVASTWDLMRESVGSFLGLVIGHLVKHC